MTSFIILEYLKIFKTNAHNSPWFWWNPIDPKNLNPMYKYTSDITVSLDKLDILKKEVQEMWFSAPGDENRIFGENSP